MLKTPSVYENIAQAIIREQEQVIGPVAYYQAQNVPGIKVGSNKLVKIISKDPKSVLQNLVLSYSQLFGRASIELSKDAIKSLNASPQYLPEILKN